MVARPRRKVTRRFWCGVKVVYKVGSGGGSAEGVGCEGRMGGAEGGGLLSEEAGIDDTGAVYSVDAYAKLRDERAKDLSFCWKYQGSYLEIAEITTETDRK